MKAEIKMEEPTGRMRRAESFTFIPRSHMVDRPLSLLTRQRSLPELTPVVKYEPRCSFPTYLFRRNWEIVNDHFQNGPYISSPFGRSSLHDPWYGSAYTQPAIWSYYTPPNSQISTPRRYYDYDHKMGPLNSAYLPRYVYYPAYTYNMDYYFGSTPRRSAYDSYYSKPYRTWKTDHLSDEIERNFRSYDRQPYSTLDSYRLSNDLYWERRFKNYSSRQQYTWARDRSLLPTKLSSYDQFHVYGGFRPRRESYTANIPGQSTSHVRSPSMSAVQISI